MRISALASLLAPTLAAAALLASSLLTAPLAAQDLTDDDQPSFFNPQGLPTPLPQTKPDLPRPMVPPRKPDII